MFLGIEKYFKDLKAITEKNNINQNKVNLEMEMPLRI